MSAFFELDSPQRMHADAVAVHARLPLVAPGPPYVDLYSDFPHDLSKKGIEISAAAQRLASAVFF